MEKTHKKLAKIYTRYNELLAQKEIRDDRKYTYLNVQEATGLAQGTITVYAKNRVTSFSAKTLIALCNFFECPLDEFLKSMPQTAVAQ